MDRSFRDLCVVVTGMVTVTMLWLTYISLGKDWHGIDPPILLVPLAIGAAAIVCAKIGLRAVNLMVVSIVAMLFVAGEYVRDAYMAAFVIGSSLAFVVTMHFGLFNAVSILRIRLLLAAQMVLLAVASIANDIRVSLAIAFLSHGVFIFLHIVPVRDGKPAEPSAPPS